ncbi:ParB/RepB/Spo0J family partition protein [Variovorax saccharolyticus]|uniref:ParB/RepB/Spo0J family partition protein n=1 Tax=Variovorax saccharolyticus TaxID=3053516 RepID=UPI00257741BC|nr:ParB/RepB/Spo0J family partition protein [Variovorax sp. J31P216]MDM0029802.1 ParB/RepB/Spo0J family partition protein [Variovorax sp. J31P216]
MSNLEKRARARAISLDDPAPTSAVTPPLPGTPAPEHPASPLHVRTNTAPGALAKFMVSNSETHKENTALKAKLAEFQDSLPVRSLDPTLIAATKWANRVPASFENADFAQLKTEIQNAGGNVQPIKVRPRAASQEQGDPAYEIVFGHRRHRACLELGLPVNAIIDADLDEQALYLEMERENRNRADLSAWEQGLMYARALEAGLFGSIRQLAAAIDRDQSQISKALALAKLPAEVVEAFGSPLDLQFRWSSDLREAVQKDPEGVLSRARTIRALNPLPAPSAIFTMLVSNASMGVEVAAPETAGAAWRWNTTDGQKWAVLKTDRKGGVTLSIAQPVDAARREELCRLVDAFLRGSVRAAKPTR